MKRLKREIWLVLALPLAGCSKHDAATTGGGASPRPPRAADAAVSAQVATAPVAAPAPPSSTDAAVAAPVVAPNTMHMPSCPNGHFCVSARDAQAVAARKSGAVNGCPDTLDKAPVLQKGVPSDSRFTFDQPGTAANQAKGHKTVCCYDWVLPCPGGRPVIDDDAPRGRTMSARPGDAWGSAPAGPIEAALAQRLVRAWTADALAEHASVAAFARATLELMAVGALPDLLAAHQLAALDEIRHARACFALAARVGGEAVEPGPLAAPAPRGGGLARLAHDTFLGGCVGETIAALAVRRGASGCADARVARTLAAIAIDEGRHSALAWRTVAWALAQGGAPVHDALVAAHAEALTDEKRLAAASTAAPDPALAAHGRLDAPGQLACRRDAWREIIAPAIAELGV